MVRIIEQSRQAGLLPHNETGLPAEALAPTAAGPLLADQLFALIEKYSFAQILLSVTEQFSDDNNKPDALLCQHFQDPQKPLVESIIALLEVLNDNAYINEDPSAKILLPSLTNYLELEHNPDTHQDDATLRDRICSVLTKRPQEKSKPLMI
jgi:hypothetical protein